MTAAYPPAMTAEPTAQPVNPPSVGAAGAGAAGSADAPREREKTAIPRNPGRRDLGMKATLLFPDTLEDAEPELRRRYEDQIEGSLGLYGDLLEAGIPGEDARFVFPNATRTNLVMTTNLRALIHMSGLRLCTMAQWEIRRLFQLIRHEVFAVSPFLGSFLAPKCVPLGYCDEFNNRDGHCPIRPHK